MRFIDIVVMTCNSKATIAQCIDSIRRAIEAHAGHASILLFDDASDDGTLAFAKGHFQIERAIGSTRRLGFPSAATQALLAGQSELAFLLNADVLLDPHCLTHLEMAFKRDDVFAVTPVGYLSDGTSIDTARCTARLERGWFKFIHAHAGSESAPTLYASGGYMMVRREAFLELGGFCPLFTPGYWEDVDLCYRAWKRGWTVLCEPKAKVIHLKGHAFGTLYTPSQLIRLKSRNRFLFMWQNLDASWLIYHFAWMPLKLAKASLTGKLGFFQAFFGALGKVHDVRRTRKRELRLRRRSDADIAAVLSGSVTPSPLCKTADLDESDAGGYSA